MQNAYAFAPCEPTAQRGPTARRRVRRSGGGGGRHERPPSWLSSTLSDVQARACGLLRAVWPQASCGAGTDGGGDVERW
jgi:hypothetical protein